MNGDGQVTAGRAQVFSSIPANTVLARLGAGQRTYEGDSEIVFQHACHLGREGIMSKRHSRVALATLRSFSRISPENGNTGHF